MNACVLVSVTSPPTSNYNFFNRSDTQAYVCLCLHSIIMIDAITGQFYHSFIHPVVVFFYYSMATYNRYLKSVWPQILQEETKTKGREGVIDVCPRAIVYWCTRECVGKICLSIFLSSFSSSSVYYSLMEVDCCVIHSTSKSKRRRRRRRRKNY